MLPSLLRNEFTLTKKNALIFLLVMSALVLCGGVMAIVLGDATKPKHAFFYGAGWEALVKGAAETARRAAERS